MLSIFDIIDCDNKKMSLDRKYFNFFFRLTYVEDILVSPGPCNIPIIDGQSFTNQQFLKEFAYKHPFVLRDASNNNVIFLKLIFSVFKM